MYAEGGCMKDGDRKLIERFKSGDTTAFKELVERYKRRAYYVALDLMGTHEDAEDIFQEAFIKVYRSIGSFRGDAQFSTWLHRIVVNLCINEKRKKSSTMMEYYGDSIPEEAHHAHGSSSPDHPEKALRSSKIQEHIQEALDRLPAKQKAVFLNWDQTSKIKCRVEAILLCSRSNLYCTIQDI